MSTKNTHDSTLYAVYTNITDLTMHHVETIGHCAELLKTGISKRITSATYMNAHSSR